MIHSTSLISKRAKIDKGVTIGPFSIVHDNVIIKSNTVIGAYCELGIPTLLSNGDPLVISENSLIRSHSVFYEGSNFGAGLVTGHAVRVRELTIAGKSLQIGSGADIQGDCQFGSYVRTQSNVFVSQKSKIENFVWLMPFSKLTNDPHPPSDIVLGCHIKDYSVVAANSTILPGVCIGEHALVAANSLVKHDVPPHTVVAGSPAKFICLSSEIPRRDGSGEKAYPWTEHFFRGYPEEVTKSWAKRVF